MDDIELFYSDLRFVLSDVPQHNIYTLLSDFNAKMDQEHQKFT